MKTFCSFLIGLALVCQTALAGEPSDRFKMAIRLESKPDPSGITLVLFDDQIGVYHHYILERSLDGKTFAEVARTEETSGQGAREIVFRDFPFERNSLPLVHYRIRAVDEVGWFDFTNIVQVYRKQDLAQKPEVTREAQY